MVSNRVKGKEMMPNVDGAALPIVLPLQGSGILTLQALSIVSESITMTLIQ